MKLVTFHTQPIDVFRETTHLNDEIVSIYKPFVHRFDTEVKIGLPSFTNEKQSLIFHPGQQDIPEDQVSLI